MRKFAVFIPKRINFENTIKHHKGIDANFLKYLIYILLSKISQHIESSKRSGSTYIRIDQLYVEIPKVYQGNQAKYKRHIDFLKSEMLELTYRSSRTRYRTVNVNVFNTKRYIKGVKPYTYQLGFYFNKYPLKVDYISDSKLIRKLIDNQSNYPTIITSGKYKFLNKFFDPKKLNIDFDRAIDLCTQRRRESRHHSYSKYLNEFKQLLDLKNGIYRLYYNNETDRRLHSNITRLPKVYRRFISYDNKQLVEVDLSNSIIYFLAALLSNKLNQQVLQKHSLLLMFHKSLESLDIKEIELMFKLAIEGSFYDDFMNNFDEVYSLKEIEIFHYNNSEEEFVGGYKQKRKVVKKRILAMLFAGTNHYTIEQDIFSLKYPTILKNINKFKSDKDYEKFSHALFQIEAHYMLNEVARNFNRVYYKKAPLFTLHDCLITTIDFEEQLRSVMKETFTQLLGVPPKMEAEKW